MLNQVRKTRRAALLAATTCTLLIASGAVAAAIQPGATSGPASRVGPGPHQVSPTDPAESAGSAADAWSLDLGTVTDDDTGVRSAAGSLRLDVADPTVDVGPRSAGATQQVGATDAAAAQASGQLVSDPVDLASPAAAITADVDASTPGRTSVVVDVRGRLADQGPDSWTEWVPAGDPLPGGSATIQARVTLVGAQGTGPAVHRVTLTPQPAHPGAGEPGPGGSGSLQDAETEAAPTSGESVYQVYATREGLVGGTTANGHVITERDHFVALPSRRGLSAKGSGSYSVRVCAESTGRCAYAPVWDIGPWNTTDDYWNPAGTRESWTDLPQGTPQAQAAFEDGYNGGLDGFDREVANPAGIDLADGTFWDGVGLTDNGWTTVTYLWTGSGPKGVVGTAGGPLTVRSEPSTDAGAVGTAGDTANVVIECTATGSTVTGTYGTSDVWNRIGPGNWVADAYVDTGSSTPVAPAC